MELWSPPHDAPHLLEWWRPLILVSARARADGFPWPVHIDEFRLSGRVKRQGRPDVWIYEHHANGGSVCVDSMGQTYKFMATPGGKGPGQFRQCPLRTALWRARLPDVVAPVSYAGPAVDDQAADAAACYEAGMADAAAEATWHDDHDADHGDGHDDEVREVRRGHLTLVAG